MFYINKYEYDVMFSVDDDLDSKPVHSVTKRIEEILKIGLSCFEMQF